MPLIELQTIINAEIELCFDLSRSIDLHKISTSHTKEKAVDGKTSGLISLNEFVTWQAIHFGIPMYLTSKITAYERPFFFRDEQIKGPFKYIRHDHKFNTENKKVVMVDVFDFESPLNILGKIVDRLLLTTYLKKLLLKRNMVIKDYAENNKWKELFN